MSYIDRNLLPGERVIYRTRLHWNLFVMPALFTAVILLPGTWFLAKGDERQYAWIPVVIALLVFAPPLIKRHSSDFAVTSKRVMIKVGVFTTRSIELLLGKIEAIAVHQTLAGRLFGYGDIIITGSGGTKEAFSNIQAPLEFRRAVQSVTDTQTGGGASPREPV